MNSNSIDNRSSPMILRLCLFLLASVPASAAMITATPANVAAQIALAKAGDTLTLSSGEYGVVAVKGRIFAPLPLTINAGTATFNSVQIASSEGVTWNGGSATVGTPKTGYCFWAVESKRVTFNAVRTIGCRKAILFDRVTDGLITGSFLRDFTTDGINTALSQRIRVSGNTMVTFSTGLEHPDCWQSWSKAGGISSDIVVENNICIGDAQGFSAFNTVGDPGYDRITMRGNIARVSYPQGLNCSECRNSLVTGNDIRSLPGSRSKTSINIVGGIVRSCGNVVADVPRSPAIVPC